MSPYLYQEEHDTGTTRAAGLPTAGRRSRADSVLNQIKFSSDKRGDAPLEALREKISKFFRQAKTRLVIQNDIHNIYENIGIRRASNGDAGFRQIKNINWQAEAVCSLKRTNQS